MASARPGFPRGFVALLVVTLLLFAITAATVADSRGSDPAGDSLSDVVAAMFAVALWIALAVLLVMAKARGTMVFWAPWALFALVPMAALAFFLAINSSSHGDKSALIVVFALPPLLILHAAWARFAELPGRISSMLLAVVGVLSIGTTAAHLHAGARAPQKAEAEKARLQETAKAEREAREHEAAAFAALGPDSHIADYLPYARNRAFAEQAQAGIQKVKSRQADAVALLGQRPLIDLTELSEWNVLATREMCEAYANAFLRAANQISKTTAMDLEWQLPNLKWMLGAKCDLSGPLERAETNIKAVADSERLRNFAATLGELLTAK